MTRERPMGWREHVSLSKSVALASYQVDDLLESHELLLREREEVRERLATITGPMSEVRRALNDLVRVLADSRSRFGPFTDTLTTH